MIRIGYQVWFQLERDYNSINRETYWQAHTIFMNKEKAEEYTKTFLTGITSIREVEIIEDDESLFKLYNQVEQEDPNYRKELENILIEVEKEVKEPKKLSKEEKLFFDEEGNLKAGSTRAWLRYLSNQALKEDKPWWELNEH